MDLESIIEQVIQTEQNPFLNMQIQVCNLCI